MLLPKHETKDFGPAFQKKNSGPHSNMWEVWNREMQLKKMTTNDALEKQDGIQ